MAAVTSALIMPKVATVMLKFLVIGGHYAPTRKRWRDAHVVFRRSIALTAEAKMSGR